MNKLDELLLTSKIFSSGYEPRRNVIKQCTRSKNSPHNKKKKRCKYSGRCEGYKAHCKFRLEK